MESGNFIRSYVLSLAAVIAVGFLLLVSLLLTAGIYYSAQIVLMGAEFTRAHALRKRPWNSEAQNYRLTNSDARSRPTT